MPPINRMLKTQADPAVTHATAFVTNIVGLIDELTAIMLQEEALIQARQHKEYADLLQRKQRLTIEYRASYQTLSTQQNILRDAPPELRKKAKEAAKKLAAVTDRNAYFLRGAILASEKLVASVMRLIKEQVMPKAGYVNTRAGKLLGTYSPVCDPVSVNRTA